MKVRVRVRVRERGMGADVGGAGWGRLRRVKGGEPTDLPQTTSCRKGL